MSLTLLAAVSIVLMAEASPDPDISGGSSEINSAVEEPSPTFLPGLLYPRESESREVSCY